MSKLVSDAEALMNIALEVALLDKEWESDDSVSERIRALWSAHKDVFVETTNAMPQIGALYGIFLNCCGANVLSWYASNNNNPASNGALLES